MNDHPLFFLLLAGCSLVTVPYEMTIGTVKGRTAKVRIEPVQVEER